MSPTAITCNVFAIQLYVLSAYWPVFLDLCTPALLPANFPSPRFLDAALRFYELSSLSDRTIGNMTLDEDELIQALVSAITCTILAAAGPQRSRMLSTLYKDERSAKLPIFPFLEKVYLERILRK